MTHHNKPRLLSVDIRRTLVGMFVMLACLLLANCAILPSSYFSIQFVDDQTGRGIPLVEIESTNRVRFVSDSAGRIAFDPGEIQSSSIFFSVYSHGYEMPADTLDTRGIYVTPEGGKQLTVRLHRVNIAERLYRETGEGIYRDSQLLGARIPLPYEDRPRGGVFGQDSVINAIYHDQLYWFWGDTNRAESPLGNFKVSGAVSPLGDNNHYDPAEAVDLTYFVGEDSFVRQMLPLEGNGLVWIHGLVVLKENGRDYMLTGYSRMSNATTRVEAGIALWNDQKQVFEKLVEFPPDTKFYPHGHPLTVVDNAETWIYFGYAIPDIRVRATLKDLLNVKNYQGYTCLKPGSRWNENAPALERDKKGRLVWGWKAGTEPVSVSRWSTIQKQGLVNANESKYVFVDAETGDPVIPHSGSVAWNEHRHRWIIIFGQIWGTKSFLGEIWYAEAPTPEGPWSAARKIVTHDRYSFYNVKQHPYFADGKYIYFEGTYTQSFSGNDRATPRYDYNQIMYRLDLDDPRLPHSEEAKRNTNKGS